MNEDVRNQYISSYLVIFDTVVIFNTDEFHHSRVYREFWNSLLQNVEKQKLLNESGKLTCKKSIMDLVMSF